MTEQDAILEELRLVHAGIKDAGSAYLRGEHARALDELVTAIVDARDVAADLRRLVERTA